MIKSFTASTREIDDPEAAVAEIKKALDLDNKLLKHSLGIISCFSEFDETGVCKAICDALPFECIGATTCLCASGHEVDQVFFAITVLTSDDCSFKTALVPVAKNYEESTESAISGLLGQTGADPALLLAYFPLMNTVSGDMLLAAIDRVTGGIPLFGALTIDHHLDYHTAKTICNGEMFRESFVLGAIYGNPKFTFEVASIDENKIMSQKAIITESDGNILIGINGKKALEYFNELGLTKNELSIGMGFIPLVIDYRDGTKPIARGVFTLTPEGHAVCGGVMPVNTTLSIARMDKDDIVITTESILKPLITKDSVLLSYSCLARYLVLGIDNRAEAEKVRNMAGDSHYIFAYTGGEICPLPDADGKLKNYFHNYTNVFCLLS